MKEDSKGAMAGESASRNDGEAPATIATTTATAAELLRKIKEGVADGDTYRQLLDKEPPGSWVKTHPMVRNLQYLPIDKVEMLLDRLFKNWSVEVIDYRVIANSICVHLRLRVVDYEGSERVFDGFGAAPIQTKSGASPIDHSAILTDAVMKALPAAKSFALKDAAEHLGNIFGRNLGRKISEPVTGGSDEIINNIKEKIQKK